MNSQEDNLEQLLQDIAEMQTESAPAQPIEDTSPATVEDTASLSVEDIEKLLAESQKAAREDTDFMKNQSNLSEEELFAKVLSEGKDADLAEIKDLLQKSDNHEEIAGTVEQTASERDYTALENEQLSKAEKRKLQREANREARRAAREAKRAEKEAKRAEREANKFAKETGEAEKAAERQAKTAEERKVKTAEKEEKRAKAAAEKEEKRTKAAAEKEERKAKAAAEKEEKRAKAAAEKEERKAKAAAEKEEKRTKTAAEKEERKAKVAAEKEEKRTKAAAEKEEKRAKAAAEKEEKRAKVAAEKEERKAKAVAEKEERKAKTAGKANKKSNKAVGNQSDSGKEKDDSSVLYQENASDIADLLKAEEDYTTEEVNGEAAMPQQEEKTESAEDALLKELESFDFLNDMLQSDKLEAASASAGSAAQPIEEAQKPKKGLWARFIDFISEEEEEEETHNDDIILSDENQQILKEMEKEKGKKKKPKKKKKGKNTGEESPEGEEEGTKKNKKDKKPKKEKKPKKVKEPKEDAAAAADSSKRIPIKNILIIAVVCASIGASIILFVQVVGDYSVKQTAKKAFYKGDYQTCYQNLFGKDLSETEQVMYGKSESILTIHIWLREYELLAEEGQELEALDSLLQSVYDYQTLYAYAAAWKADAEVTEVYKHILSILSDKYHLTEEQAKEIANNPDDIQYTKKVMAIVQGEPYISENEEEIKKDLTENILNPLPEEEELGNTNFVDNNSNG